MSKTSEIKCGFCQAGYDDAEKFVESIVTPGIFICNNCLKDFKKELNTKISLDDCYFEINNWFKDFICPMMGIGFPIYNIWLVCLHDYTFSEKADEKLISVLGEKYNCDMSLFNGNDSLITLATYLLFNKGTIYGK